MTSSSKAPFQLNMLIGTGEYLINESLILLIEGGYKFSEHGHQGL